MKKKLIAMLLMGCMVLSMTACGEKKETEKKDNETEQTDENESADEGEQEDYSALGTSTLKELGEYKGIPYQMLDVTVTDEMVEEEVQRIVKNSTMKEPEETATETSVVNIDYVGKKDGTAFDGGTAEGQELDIANSHYIPGFAESIVGMKVGETKDCPMTFPEDYQNEELAGAEVVFTITVNECWKNVPAVLNDEFAASNGCKNVEEFYEQVRENYEEAKEEEAKYDREYQIIKGVIDNSTFDINDQETALYVKQIKGQHENIAYMYYGTDLETYVTEVLGVTMEQYEKDCEESALYRLQSTLVKMAVAEKEKMEVSEEDYKEGAEEYRAYYGYEDLESFEGAMGKENIRQQILLDEVTEFLVENAVETEA